MPKKETDPLRKWMKENGVWQLDLCKMFESHDVESLSDFQTLPKSTVLEIIDDAKKTGFMHSAKLKDLHGGFPKKKKKKKKAAPKKSSGPAPKSAEELKRDARAPLEKYMRENGIWQIDLFDLITGGSYEIYSVDELEEALKNKYNEDEEWIDEFLTDAKQCGVMGKQATTLAVFCGKKKKAKKKKKAPEKPKQSKPVQKDAETLRREARKPLEKWMRANDIWQIDLFDMIVGDQYEIYSVEQFQEEIINEDKQTRQEFLREAKHCGVMGQQVNYLRKVLKLEKKKKPKKEQPEKKEPAKPKEKVLSPEEIENKARAKMEPYMTENGFWHKDLFLILLEYEVYQPSDLKGVKGQKKQILQEAKQKGLIGQKVKKFKAHLQNL